MPLLMTLIKILQCGTCGIVLSTTEIAQCDKCKQIKIDKNTWIGTLVDDWQKRKVSIQYEPPEWERRRIKRMDQTDDVSSVTSGDLSYREECEKAYLQLPLSRSDRESRARTSCPTPATQTRPSTNSSPASACRSRGNVCIAREKDSGYPVAQA